MTSRRNESVEMLRLNRELPGCEDVSLISTSTTGARSRTARRMVLAGGAEPGTRTPQSPRAIEARHRARADPRESASEGVSFPLRFSASPERATRPRLTTRAQSQARAFRWLPRDAFRVWFGSIRSKPCAPPRRVVASEKGAFALRRLPR